MVSPLVCGFMGLSGLYAYSNIMQMMHQVSCPGLLHQCAFCINTPTRMLGKLYLILFLTTRKQIR